MNYIDGTYILMHGWIVGNKCDYISDKNLTKWVLSKIILKYNIEQYK